MSKSELHVSTQVLSNGQDKENFAVPREASLLEIMQEGATRAGVVLLPIAEPPLDLLHNIGKHHEVGPPINVLSSTIEEFLESKESTNDFAIELLRVIRVNNRSKVATESSMSPRQILNLFDLKFEEYSLYRQNSTELLPPDTAIALTRGEVFAAQKDGKYGRRGWHVSRCN